MRHTGRLQTGEIWPFHTAAFVLCHQPGGRPALLRHLGAGLFSFFIYSFTTPSCTNRHKELALQHTHTHRIEWSQSIFTLVLVSLLFKMVSSLSDCDRSFRVRWRTLNIIQSSNTRRPPTHQYKNQNEKQRLSTTNNKPSSVETLAVAELEKNLQIKTPPWHTHTHTTWTKKSVVQNG